MCCYPKYCSCVISACSPAGWRSSLAVTTSSRAVTPSGCDVFFYFCNTVSFTWSVEERRERHRGTDGQWVTDEREGERQSASLTFTQWLDSVLHAIRRCPKKTTQSSRTVENTPNQMESDRFPRIPSPLSVHFIHSFLLPVSSRPPTPPSPRPIHLSGVTWCCHGSVLRLCHHCRMKSAERRIICRVLRLKLPSANVASSVVTMQHPMWLIGLKDAIASKRYWHKNQIYIYRIYIFYVLFYRIQNPLVAATRLVSVLYGNESWWKANEFV